MSEPTSQPSPDDAPTVKLPPGADAAARGAATGASWFADAPSEWGNWTYPSPDELGAQMQGYDVEKLLGRGGMGAVYQGRQRTLERNVAIKVLPLELSHDPDFAARFHREAKAMARFDHPNIVRVFEFGKTSRGLLFFTMELVGGGDVKELLAASGPLPVAQAARVMLDVCGALEHAHRHGTIHRDIKPANILLSADGLAKVADFGLVRIADVESEFGTTRVGGVMGSPDFMAPEQRIGAPVSPASDVFAVGVVLYQLLTGRLPQGAWEPPSAVRQQRRLDADPRFDAIVTRALQEDPFARFPDAGAMRRAVEQAFPPAFLGASPSRGTPHWWAMAAAALALAGGLWGLSHTPVWPVLHNRLTAAAINLAAPADRAWIDRVVLLDISRLEPEERMASTGPHKVTPRDKLLALVKGLAAERPQAIAVDIDFSRSSYRLHEPHSPEDPEFFRALLKLRNETGVPIFVGVYRQDSAGRDGWLGSSEFAPLATGLGIAPNERDVVERMPLDLVSKKDGAVLSSLSAAMARAAGVMNPAGAMTPLMSRSSTLPLDGPLTVTEYTPNFAPLDRLAWQRVSGVDPEDVPGLRQRLQRNLIILSDAELGSSDADDTFATASRPGVYVPGAYLHACGLITLLSGPPATLTGTGRAIAALLFVGGLVLASSLVQRTVRKQRDDGAHRVSRQWAKWLATTAVVMAAFLCLRGFRVAWPDGFCLIAGLLLVRPLASAFEAMSRRVFAAWRTR